MRAAITKQVLQVTRGDDPVLDQAFIFYRRNFPSHVRTPEKFIRKWIDTSMAIWKRPLIYVVVKKAGRVVGILHYTYIENLHYAFVSYIAAVEGAFYDLLRFLKKDLEPRGCSGIIFEVEKLGPGLSPEEYERRTNRLKVFLRHGARIMESVRFRQPNLEGRKQLVEQELHLMFAPLQYGQTHLPANEVRRILDFIYTNWYAAANPTDRWYRWYLKWTAFRSKLGLPGQVHLTTPDWAEFPGKPPRREKRVLVSALIVALGVLYKEVDPVKTFLNRWIDVLMDRTGNTIFIVVLVLLVAAANWWLSVYGRQYES